MLLLVIISSLAFVSAKECDTEVDHHKLLLSLNRRLLSSLETQGGRPNPSVHLALRLSSHHNLAMENNHLNSLKTKLHNDLQSSLSNSQAVTGLLALYTLALKSSCFDLSTVSFSVQGRIETLLMHLKQQMEQEKDHMAYSAGPLTNYYQYSLGVLALCVSSVRVNNHVTNKLIHAAQHEDFRHGDSESVDTYAMAGMALQCVKNAGFHVHSATGLNAALAKIKQKLLASRKSGGHIGNEFSTGLAVQALLAMGSPETEYTPALEAMRTSVRCNVYHNPMAMSQVLPALNQKSYLTVKHKQCLSEDDSLVLEPKDPVMELDTETTVNLTVEVVTFSNKIVPYYVDVPKGSTLLEALGILRDKTDGFTFETESSLWGPFLSVVNGEQARQSDRRYWSLSSNGNALTEGASDFKIKKAQKITIQNKSY
ncbi:transcobalamin-2 [Takifugu rubripes]|nr:transcobalamin-2-like [Takifugu rubripes]XP_029685436.1 transcobalamin-2-like [Takifugu rubripes]|eukprot:XP_011614010.1 PREDICTED: transcobalamin-2-like [Takifugu rubripes]